MLPDTHFTTQPQRWQAVASRNPDADGAFFYGVATTGIYCRPACTSRRPKEVNTRFFDTWRAAEVAGFRACKRCHPQAGKVVDEATTAVRYACRLIDAAEQPLTLQQLADAVGLSRHHLHRQFKKIVGITPKQYADQRRLERIRTALPDAASVTDAIYDAGYESSSRFYEKAVPALGMKPATYLKGGVGLRIQYAIVDSYLGLVLVAATEQGVCEIAFGDTPDYLLAALHARFPEAELIAQDSAFGATIATVLAFLEQPSGALDLPLDIQGTAFQQRVWSALRQIPVGETLSYGGVAKAIGLPQASRAVAQACGANHLAVAIPCHRVVRGDGSLGGYRWGVAVKKALLDRESILNAA